MTALATRALAEMTRTEVEDEAWLADRATVARRGEELAALHRAEPPAAPATLAAAIRAYETIAGGYAATVTPVGICPDCPDCRAEGPLVATGRCAPCERASWQRFVDGIEE